MSNVSLAKRMYLSVLPGQVFSSAIVTVTPIINTFIIGNYIGEEGLAAGAFIFPFTLVVGMIANMISTGSQVRCGTYLGSGNKEGFNRVFSLGMILCASLGLILTALTLLFAPVFAYIFGASTPADNLVTADYLSGMGVGVVFMVMSTSVLMFLQLDNAKKVAYTATVLMIVSTVVLDFVFAVNLGLGMYGIGLASVSGHLVIVLTGAFYYFSKKCGFRFMFKSGMGREIPGILRAGSPLCLKNICNTVRITLVNNITMALGGAPAVACLGVFFNCNSLCYIIPSGLNSAGSIVASVFTGERDVDSLKAAARFANRISVVVYLAEYALLFVFAKDLSVFFGIDRELLGLCSHVVIIASINVLGDMLSYTNLGFYQGMNHPRIVSIMHCLNNGLIAYVLIFVLPNIFGLDGVWMVFGLSAIIPSLGLLVFSAIKHKRIPRGIADSIMISPKIQVDPGDSLSISVSDMGEVSGTSIAIISFLKDKPMEEKRRMYAGLCLEEITRNILEHGYKKSGKTGRIDVCAIYEDEGVSLLIRDRGIPFDPTKWMEIYNGDDPAANIGLKLVSRLSSRMEYQSTLGLNVLWVHV